MKNLDILPSGDDGVSIDGYVWSSIYYPARFEPSEVRIRVELLRRAVADYRIGVTYLLQGSIKWGGVTWRNYWSAKTWIERLENDDSFSFNFIMSEILRQDPDRTRKEIYNLRG